MGNKTAYEDSRTRVYSATIFLYIMAWFDNLHNLLHNIKRNLVTYQQKILEVEDNEKNNIMER